MVSFTLLSTDSHYKKTRSDLHRAEVLQVQRLLRAYPPLGVQLQHLLNHLDPPFGDLRKEFFERLAFPARKGGLGVGEFVESWPLFG